MINNKFLNYFPELLSPAGDFLSLQYAIKAGANSVYMGGKKFGARAYAKSVEDNNIIDCINFCHKYNRKFYLTVNTIVKQKEFDDLKQYLDELVDYNIDAFLVQDLGVADFLKNRYNIPLHISTQMGIFNIDTIKELEDFGFKQIVLPRELSINEIKNIKKNTNMKIEVFIHGSMCYSYSGCCLMSSFIGNNSGNRGRCKGTCRLKYKYKNLDGYILSMKDLCSLKYLSELIDIGVDSFKIEGRMRSPIYVLGTTNIYREYIDFLIRENCKYDEKTINEKIYILQQLYDKSGYNDYYYKHNDKNMIQIVERKKRIPDEKVFEELKRKFEINNCNIH